jgi:hypothetical protein
MQRACIRIKCKDICLLFSSESKGICPQRAFCLRSRGKCTFTEITRFLPSDSELKPFYSALCPESSENIPILLQVADLCFSKQNVIRNPKMG